MKNKWTQREWDRTVGIGSPPTEETPAPILPEYELDKSTGEPIKKWDVQIGWREEDFD